MGVACDEAGRVTTAMLPRPSDDGGLPPSDRHLFRLACAIVLISAVYAAIRTKLSTRSLGAGRPSPRM